MFIAASVNDACSNSLIEALQSGLPAVVANSGGHPELVKNGGLVFNSEDDILEAIDKLASNFDHFKKNLPRYLIQEAGEQYLRFLESIFKSKKQFPEKKTDIFLKIMRYISFELFFVKNWLNKIRSTRKWP
ncbi:MAG: glycosyltransferase [Candidatus Hermodarchaeota archaeon]